MTDGQDPPDAIQWHEGMLLSPQHFQQMDLRIEALLAYHRAVLSPYHWGVRDYELDETALADGILRVIALEAVLPDGLVLSYRDRGEEHLEIDLSPQMGDLESAAEKIWLAVPTNRNHRSWTAGDLPRYRSVGGEPTRDMNSGEDEVLIPRLRPIPSLHLKKPTKLYSFFPLVEVTNRENVLSLTDFCPPCLFLPKHSSIWRMCADLNASLRRKITNLAATLESQRGDDPAVVAELEDTLHHLVAGLPQYEALLAGAPPHPFALYLALANLTGHLAALSESKVPKPPPPYDHNDPRAAFAILNDDLTAILERRIAESWVPIHFIKREDHYTLHFRREWQGRDLVLAVTRGHLSERDTVRWMRGAIIAPRSTLNSLRERRMLGLERTHAKSVPGLARPESDTLFRVSPVRVAVEDDEELVVWPVTREVEVFPTTLTLYIR